MDRKRHRRGCCVKTAATGKLESEFLSPSQCEEIADEGFPQGKTRYLWHKDKRTGWELYKRNHNNLSGIADMHGNSRWVSAVTEDQAIAWRGQESNRVNAEMED